MSTKSGEVQGVVSLGLLPDAFDAYARSIELCAWRPEFVVLHNTGVPRLDTWHAVSGSARMTEFIEYYRDEQHWSAGPHLFVADDLVWVFTPLTTPGVHSPSWNQVSWGVEIVGDYDSEALADPVLGNTVRALATLHDIARLDPSTLRFHKEDPLTSHRHCPGAYVDKQSIVERLTAQLADMSAGEHRPDRLAAK